MAYPTFISSLYVLISLFLMIACTSHCFELNNVSEDHYEKVNLTLYYETLCPGCEGFIVNDLVRVFNTDLKSIVNLHLVPFGNANVTGSNKTVTCQHGPLECFYNTIEACALDVWPLKVAFPFIHCVESGLEKKQDDTVWGSCCETLKLDSELINKCYNTGHGKELILRNAEETGSLSPPHQFVPWVTVNNKPLLTDFEKFISYICSAYKGQPKPRACTTLEVSTKKAKASDEQACHANEAIII